MRILKLVLITLIMFTLGCSTKVEVKEININDKNSAVGGIPFRVLEPHIVRVYAKDPTTSQYKEVFAKSYNLANEDTLYSLNYEADYFAHPNFEVAFQNDNTLKTLNISDQSHLAEAMKGLSATAKDVSTAAADYDLNRLKAKKDRLAAEADVLTSEVGLVKAKTALPDFKETVNSNQEARLESALKALNLAEAAQRELDTITQKAGSTSLDIENAEAKVRLARLQANQAYRRAGLPEPYPGVFP
jgi:hypothetical protein